MLVHWNAVNIGHKAYLLLKLCLAGIEILARLIKGSSKCVVGSDGNSSRLRYLPGRKPISAQNHLYSVDKTWYES